MTTQDYTQLQQQYGGCYVAWRDAEVIASAETYDELSDQLESLPVEGAQLIIEYIEPVSSLRVY